MTPNSFRLMPRTLDGIMARALADAQKKHSPEAIDAAKKAARKERLQSVVMVIRYVCPDCDEEYECREAAADCCAKDDVKPSPPEPEYGFPCPVCGEKYDDPHAAADCCLWKDLDAPTRWRMADAVADGSTWAAELGIGGMSL